jgi:hypothetical protein
MRNPIFRLSLIALLSGLAAATHAGQVVVWSTDAFINDAVGPYGTTTQFGGTSNPRLNIVDPGMGGPGSHAMELVWDQDTTFINFQSAGIAYPTSGNTNTLLANYTLEFDMQVIGVDAGPYPQGFQISIFGTGGNVFNGPKVELDLTTNVFPAGQGYQHYSFTLDKFVPRAFDPTTNTFTVGFGIVSFGGPNTTMAGETVDIANLQITMSTNPPPPPRPTIGVLPAKPGLRIFSKNFDFTYNQSGFGTVDPNQSWVGATPSLPKSYAITFGDFDTVDNFTFYSQFVPNGTVNPFVVFGSTNALVWRITHVATGFTTAVDWKTNSPGAGETNNAITLTTTSTNGRGTWKLTFTSDTDGTVTAPDGTSGSFSLPPDAAALFVDPLAIMFGTAPNNPGGFGQHTTINRLTITNVAGVNADDDFTKDDVLNTSLWDPAFSYPLNTGPSAVVLVSTNDAYWVNWTIPDDGMGLGTKASLNSGTNVWFSPNYYGSGVGITNTVPSQMGPSLKWTLIPKACLPTVDGTTNGAVSPSGFWAILMPAPAL